MGKTKNNSYAVGAYHFYRLCKNGIEQADNFIEAVSKTKSLPPVVDLEFGGNCQTNNSTEQRTFIIKIYKTSLWITLFGFEIFIENQN